MKIYEFDAVIKKHDSINAAFIEFPYDVEIEFGTKGQVKVIATFDGHQYRGSLAKMGHHCHILGMTQKVRKAINKQPNETVHVTLQKDTEPRVVEIPDDFKKLLNTNSQAKSFYDALSYSNKKAYVTWITSAKKAETREKRLHSSIEKLINKMKRP